MRALIIILFTAISLTSCSKLEELENLKPEAKIGYQVSIEYKNATFMLNGSYKGESDGHGVVFFEVEELKNIQLYVVYGDYVNVNIIRDNTYIYRYGKVRYLYF